MSSDPSARPDLPSQEPTHWGWTVGLGLALVVVMMWALPRTIQAGDAGEFATVMLEGGVPHPSGYPWMRILGTIARAGRALGLPPATAAALGPSLLGIVGWLLLHRVALRMARDPERRLGLHVPAIATFAVALVALSPPVVLHTHDSEVWGPLVFFASLVVWLGVIASARPFVLGLALGLATSHHLTAVLLIPLCIACAWPSETTVRGVARAGALGLAGTLVGLLPYATLMVGDGDAWRWGDTRTLEGLLHHVSRSDYGILSLSLHQETVQPSWQLARAATSVGNAMAAGLVPLAIPAGLLVVVVLIASVRARPPGIPRRAILGLWTCAVLSTWVFPLAHNIDPRNPFGAWILERFDVLSLALLTPLVAAAAASLHRLVAAQKRAAIGLAICGALLLIRQTIVTAWHGVPSSDTLVQRYARDLLATPPPDATAIVFGTDDHRLFPVTFSQQVLGLGPRVLYVDASLLAHPWYREHLRRQLPGLPDEDKPVRLMQALWEDPRWRETPIYLANDFSRPSLSLPRVPEGILWRVLPPHRLDLQPSEVLRRHRAALRRYGPPPPNEPATAGHPFSADLMPHYTEGTAQLARALAAQGRTEQADALLREALDPRSVSDP